MLEPSRLWNWTYSRSLMGWLRQLYAFIFLLLHRLSPRLAGIFQVEKAIQSLGGIPAKMSQFRAMKGSLGITVKLGLPDLITNRKIQSQLSRIVPNWPNRCEKIETTGIRGSLSCVHRAQMKNGEKWAVKVLRPGILEKIDSDQRFLDQGLGGFGAFRKGFSAQDYASFFEEELQGELDLGREYRYQDRYYQLFAGDGDIVVPKPIPLEAKGAVLAMNWEHGLALADARSELNEMERDRLAAALTRFVLYPFFSEGLMHGDLNPGNLAWRSESQRTRLIVYDYGSVWEAPQETPRLFLKLLRLVDSSSAHSDGDAFLELLKALGFNSGQLKDIKDNLAEYLAILLEPFLSEVPYDLRLWNRAERARSCLGERRWQFMASAPPALFVFMRSLFGLFHWHLVLERPLNARVLLNSFLSGNLDSVSRQAKTNITDNQESQGGMSKLHVDVFVGQERKVGLILPGICAGDMESLVDFDTLAKIKNLNYDMKRLSQIASQNRFQPMDLVDVSIEEKRVHIFLAAD